MSDEYTLKMVRVTTEHIVRTIRADSLEEAQEIMYNNECDGHYDEFCDEWRMDHSHIESCEVYDESH